MAAFDHPVLSKRASAPTLSSNPNVYHQVFGAASPVHDYTHIFGDFYVPKPPPPIPVLNFPTDDTNTTDVLNSSIFDYSEVFGGFDTGAGDFAISYDQIFSVPNSAPAPTPNPPPATATSTTADKEFRTPKENYSQKLVPPDVPRTALKEHKIDSFSSLEKNCSPSSAISCNLESETQFNVSYNKATKGGKDDLVTHIEPVSQVDEVSGFTHVVDAYPPSQLTRSDECQPQESDHLKFEAVSDGAMLKRKDFTKTGTPAPAFGSDTEILNVDLNSDKKGLESDYHMAANDHHMCYSAPLVPSSESYVRPGNILLTVSEINLRTQPSQVPPPSRPPPKFVKQSDCEQTIGDMATKAFPEKDALRSSVTNDCFHLPRTVSDTNAYEDGAKDDSLPCFDVDLDASSTAAASAAAMKKAVEKAEARIKSARQLMERKGDIFQRHVKALNENDRGKGRRGGIITQERKTQVVNEEAFGRENGKEDKFTWELRQNKVRTSHVGQDESYIDIGKKTIDKWQCKESAVKMESQKQKEGEGKWKADEEFYELVKDDEFRVFEEVPIKADGHNLNEKKAVQDTVEPENRGNYRMPKEVPKQDDRKLEASSKEIQKREENKVKPEAGTKQKENVRKMEAAQQASKQDECEKKLNSVKEEKERNEKSVEATRFFCEQDNSGKGQKAVVEACMLGENDVVMEGAQMAFDQTEKQKKLNGVYEALNRDENVKRLKAENMVHKWQETEKRVHVAQEAGEQQETEKRVQATQEACGWEENKNKTLMVNGDCSERSSAERSGAQKVYQPEDNDNGVNAANGVYQLEENNKDKKAPSDDSKQADYEKKQESAQEDIKQEEYNKNPIALYTVCACEECERENGNSMKTELVANALEESEKKLAETQEDRLWIENEKIPSAAEEASEQEQNKRTRRSSQEVSEPKEHTKESETVRVVHELVENEEKPELKALRLDHVHDEENEKLSFVDKILDKNNNFVLKAVNGAQVDEENLYKSEVAHEHAHEADKESHDKDIDKTYENHKEMDAKQKECKEDTFIVREECLLRENQKKGVVSEEAHDYKEDVEKVNASRLENRQGGLEKSKTSEARYEFEENNLKLTGAREGSKYEENEKNLTEAQVLLRPNENDEKFKTIEDAYKEEVKNDKELEAAKEAPPQLDNKDKPREAEAAVELNVRKTNASNPSSELGKIKQTHERGQPEKSVGDSGMILDQEESQAQSRTAQAVFQWLENVKKLKAGQQAFVFEDNAPRTTRVVSLKEVAYQRNKMADESCKTEEKERNEVDRERDLEMERAKKLEEEREREREREKDRKAVERSNSEACDRAFKEARERAERIAVERVTAEARQRAMAEARERAERASAEARERSLAEKASTEARIRAERAAVERATAEARERSVEKVMAERAASEARERAERPGAKADSGMSASSSSSDVSDFAQHSQFRAQGESEMRRKARLERHQRTTERVAKALAEKNMRDILAQREQAEKNRLAETLDADVRRWSNGKEGNLRALLSTLQYMLGPESGWQPIPLTEVITAASVKKAYRKATLCVHPDKLQQRGASIQQKYVCEKVFDLLKEAWNKFNSEVR